jgi:pimeloyl-ACP methyl ester carboxylesterase
MYRETMGGRRKVTSGQVRLAYEVSGAAGLPPMVLLHGLGERSTGWAPVTAQFAECFRVFALDLRGHGDSDWPGAYSFELMRDDVLGAIDELCLSRITLVGHSMGGVVAYMIASQEPARIERLIVEDASPPYVRDRAIPERPAASLDFDWLVVPAIIDQVNMGDATAWDRLSAITAPTLLIGGGSESHVPQENLAQVAARIPCCELVTIPGGHHVHSTSPAEFAAVVLRWLRA